MEHRLDIFHLYVKFSAVVACAQLTPVHLYCFRHRPVCLMYEFYHCAALSQMDTIVSQRGKDNWIYEGYRYRRDRCNADGCLFHLGQSLWRRIQNEGLVNNYRDDENVRMFGKMLLALSFVPPDDVAECSDELNDNRPDELAPVYDYWEDNYIGRLRRHRRSAPTFPIALWNMRSRVTDGLTRTNDSVEGWHHAFQSSVACHHPNIYKLIEHIQTWT